LSTRALPVPGPEGPVIRLHVGLEDVRDIVADLEGAFSAMALLAA
jgi:cystathionine beta-lyase/cystathionine gamma-synthase